MPVYFAPFVGGPADGDVRPVPATCVGDTIEPPRTHVVHGVTYHRVAVQDEADLPWEYAIHPSLTAGEAGAQPTTPTGS